MCAYKHIYTDKTLPHKNVGLVSQVIFLYSKFLCLLIIERCSGSVPTCPAEVRAKDDWLPAQTFRMMNPCKASITFGLYTRFVSPWPSLPATQVRRNSLWVSMPHTPASIQEQRGFCAPTVVSPSERPHGAAILGHSHGVGAATSHLAHAADVLHQSGHVPAVAVTVTWTKAQKSNPQL